MDRLDALRLYVRVATLGSFTLGARTVGVSRVQASRAVAQLEEEFGVTLLRRSTRKLSLTPEGERFLDGAREVLRTMGVLEDSVQLARTAKGTLRVSAPVGFGQAVVGPILWQLADQNPELEVDLRLSDLFVDVIGEGFDVAIRLGEAEPSELKARTLAMAPRHLVATPEYLATAPRLEAIEDLARHPLLIYTMMKRPHVWSLGAPDGEIRHITVSGRRRADHLPTLRDWACAHSGIGYLPEWLIAPDLRDRRLVPVLPDLQPLALPVRAVFPATRRPKRVTLLLDALSRRLTTADSRAGPATSA